MDVGLLAVGAALGLGIGLVCRRNGVQVLPNYYRADLGALGKNHYNMEQVRINQINKSIELNEMKYNTRHYNHPK